METLQQRLKRKLSGQHTQGMFFKKKLESFFSNNATKRAIVNRATYHETFT